MTAATMTQPQKEKETYIHLDFATPISGEAKFTFTYSDDDSSLDSSVQSGLRNSLHSSYDTFEGLEDMEEFDNYSDADSFGEEKEEIGWRLDPDLSASDWKLVVESFPDGRKVEYHVHKKVLSQGPKKCDTFISLFRNSKDVEKGFSRSTVHANAAILVPDMLDYLYSIHNILKISSETAVGLRHLSQFFGIRALAAEVKSFIYEDLGVDNMAVYLGSAQAFDDLATLKLCAERCAENIEHLGPYPDIMADMDPSFLLDVISQKTPFRERVSPYLSRFLATYCQVHEDEILDGTVFEELTAVEYLPEIDAEAAITLLVMEAQLVEYAGNSKKALTSLQTRCIQAFAPLIRGDSGEPNDEKQKEKRRRRADNLKLLPKKVLVELVAAAYDVTPP